jgi:inorganic pyrophosphatase
MKAIIEIPKGDDRRRHLKFDKSGFVDLGPIKDVISVNEGVMPVNYGFLKNTLNKKEGDEIDVLVLSENKLKVGQEIEVHLVALIKRADGDDKIVAVDETKKKITQWEDISKSDRSLIEKFFSFKSAFKTIENAEMAKKYVKNNKNKSILPKA